MQLICVLRYWTCTFLVSSYVSPRRTRTCGYAIVNLPIVVYSIISARLSGRLLYVWLPSFVFIVSCRVPGKCGLPSHLLGHETLIYALVVSLTPSITGYKRIFRIIV